MELIEGIKHLIDGNAVIIMGAGASYGAKNGFGDFPSGSMLAKELYSACDITPDDENDLQDAAQCYEEKFTAMGLIQQVRCLLTCASFTESHEMIYSQPWLRYYTTNYDDVAELAAKKHNILLTPVTLTSNFRQYHEMDHLCVHINGHIGRLDETSLHHEFKLTSNSYLSQTNILNSQWGDLLNNDLETAKCIVILGLSLKYDLDLSKIIFNASFIDKTLVISAPDLSPNAENRLKRYGAVYKIGVDGFAAAISSTKETYVPQEAHPTDRLYTAFTYEYRPKYNLISPTPDDVFRMLLSGQYSDSLFHKSKGRYDGIVGRKTFQLIKDSILNGKRFVFIHADMGNGKTACITELRHSLSNENIHSFLLKNADSKKISEEIAAICHLSKTQKVLVIIEDYTNYMEIIHKFSLYSENNIQFVLTARSALNFNKMPDIFEDFAIKENESAVFNVNRLENSDLEDCIRIFDEYGLFGRKAYLDKAQKMEYLSRRKNGARQFQSIMLDIMQSDVMQEKVKNIVSLIAAESKQYYRTVILVLLVKVMNLRLSVTDIERIAGVELGTDALFQANVAIQELLSLKSSSDFLIKSPVTARFILQKLSNPEIIIDALYELASYAVKYCDTPKYTNILTSVISYSHVNSFVQGVDNKPQFLSAYYDRLSTIEYYRSNNFFWLQYAISCIESQNFPRAQRYLETAYGLIPDGFIPFQINNQQARFYLERILHDESSNPCADFTSAHKLLMVPIISSKDNEFNVVRLFGYYCRKKIIVTMTSNPNDKHLYKSMCKEAYARLTAFAKKHSEYTGELKDLQGRLLAAYVS